MCKPWLKIYKISLNAGIYPLSLVQTLYLFKNKIAFRVKNRFSDKLFKYSTNSFMERLCKVLLNELISTFSLIG